MKKNQLIHDWLKKMDARRITAATTTNKSAIFHIYQIGKTALIICFYGEEGEDGWEAYVPACPQNDGIKTIEALNAFITPPSEEDGWRVIGMAGVDAGMLMIADPCYCVRADSELQVKYGGDWTKALQDFYDQGGGSDFAAAQLNYVRGRAGLGVVVDTDGDGSYPIHGRFKNGRLVEVKFRTA